MHWEGVKEDGEFGFNDAECGQIWSILQDVAKILSQLGDLPLKFDEHDKFYIAISNRNLYQVLISQESRSHENCFFPLIIDFVLILATTTPR